MKSYIDFQQLLYWSCRWSLLHVAITWIGTMMIILRKRTFCPLRKSERTGFRRIRGCKESRPSAGVLRALQQQCHYGRM